MKCDSPGSQSEMAMLHEYTRNCMAKQMAYSGVCHSLHDTSMDLLCHRTELLLVRSIRLLRRIRSYLRMSFTKQRKESSNSVSLSSSGSIMSQDFWVTLLGS